MSKDDIKSKVTAALKLYYDATEKDIRRFWSMQERNIDGVMMFGATECRLMCNMGIPAYTENLTNWKKVIEYLTPIGEKMILWKSKNEQNRPVFRRL